MQTSRSAAVRKSLEAIERLNPDLEAFVYVSEPAPTGRGPLASVPVGVKDLFHVDGLPTRAGSRLPPELFASPESMIIARLRDAGAPIVGKTAMDEFAYCEPDSAGADLWVCPSTGTVAPLGYDSTGDSWPTCFWSYLGWPAVTVPVLDGPEGMPYGLQCVAPPGRDEELLAWAEQLEEVLVRR